MFGPQHLTHIIRYLDGVDSTLSQRMLRKYPPDEPALTNELCALLDADTQRAEERLSYSVEQLNADLAAVGDGLDFEVTLDTYPHNTAMERYVSQSDFGLVITYDNRVLPDENWSKAYLVQAKRLFRDSSSTEYDHRARFQAVDGEQQTRLNRLTAILGGGAVHYGLYCPQTSAIPDPTRTQVRALHTRNLADEIFDFGRGLALRDTLTTNGGIDAGIWLRSIEGKPTGLLALHNEAFRSALPFTWFVIEHFAPRSHHRSFRGLIHGGPVLSERQPDDRLKRIVMGDQQAVRELIDEIAAFGEEREAPANITVLPRHTITIKVTVGRSLPPDTARAHID
ncbi:hypothetical protein LAC81_26060 [Ensifer adhaerens]|uniref:hypothetical protein n=1 Tax=Ensifer adhaerens TaxID=106592 RepID=UPI001CBB4CD3|nr:hypothetical protein [Ensifer adhaerens]MBZ7924190.1 hypothetical protein [Ensifer adhaerens]UAX96553.1 hypothetical protein LAC78_22425 [Ensifer adhaerens]UAY04103.1 hypothetical protein LAC80_22535 [Ensifer adhaerens]UAY12089.1 hypothetical protein LAC81_26060 [Ensifer adhaerens]